MIDLVVRRVRSVGFESDELGAWLRKEGVDHEQVVSPTECEEPVSVINHFLRKLRRRRGGVKGVWADVGVQVGDLEAQACVEVSSYVKDVASV